MSKRGSRSSGYTKEEDKFLCQVYLEISQDPITGAYQTSEKFWDRVVEAFKIGKIATGSERSKKSIQCRFQTIEKAARKLNACIKQCENRRSSGASSDDIFNQAKEMLMEDPKFKSGWKFDHVWNIIKNFEKFKDGATPAKQIGATPAKQILNPCSFGYISSESENPTPDVATQASPGLSSFSLNLDDENDIIGGCPSQRPIGVKKSKLKRKCNDQTLAIIKTLEEGNRQLLEQLKKTSAQRQHHLEIQSKSYALKKIKEEDKILFKNLNTIEDPNIRAHFQARQQEILRKRSDQEALAASTSFGQYF